MIATLCETIVMSDHLLDLVGARGGGCTVPLLRADAEAMFGPRAVYANCQGTEFDFDGLVDFLVAAGRLVRQGDRLRLEPLTAASAR